MAHTLKLTGKPISELRKIKDIYSFEMEEEGSPAPPKGLYKSSKILYTVFINKKQFTKLTLTNKEFQESQFFIEGEPTLDVPMDICPGEIGLTTFQIQVIEPKQPKEPKEPKEVKEVKENKSKPKEEENKKENIQIPEKCDNSIFEHVPLDEIIVSENVKKQTPNEKKQKKLEIYAKTYGEVQQPLIIHIEEGEMNLTGRYGDYLVAKKFDIKEVPIKHNPINTIEIEKIKIPNHFNMPDPLKVQEKIAYFNQYKRWPKAVMIQKGSMVLQDGYTIYVAAKELGLDVVPIKY